MPFLTRRITETFLPEVAISLIFTYLFRHDVMYETNTTLFIVMMLCVILGGIHLFRCLAGYKIFARNTVVYLKTNLAVEGLFFVVNILCALIMPEWLYTYFFLPYKLLTVWGIGIVPSLIFVNGLKLIMVFIVPFLIKES